MRWFLAPLLWLILSYPAVAQQSFNSLGYCQVTSLTTAVALTTAACSTGSVPNGAKSIEVCVSTAAIRYTSTGTPTPTATIGIPVAAGTCFPFTGPIYSITFIRQAAGAILDIEFFQ